MSFRFLASLNSPPLVAVAGVATVAGLPWAAQTLTTASSLGVLKIANLLGFGVSVASVSVPGRIDGQLDERMRRGNLNPSEADERTPLSTDRRPAGDESNTNIYTDIHSPGMGRSMVAPAGWAFAIWGPIYLGEAIFCGAQLLSADPVLMSVLPELTAPFVAACLLQSLWCASYRPSYSTGWHKYVSVAMLGGTAWALSQAHSVIAVTSGLPFYLYCGLPLTLHFGWTTAATLVNLNGAVSMNTSTSDQTVIALGHASTVVATALGVGVTLLRSSPTYGLTLAWALAACGDKMKQRQLQCPEDSSLRTGMKWQQALCMTGSALCAVSAAAAAVL